MSEMQRQYSDSTKLMARAAIHMKYGPPGKAFSLADTASSPTATRCSTSAAARRGSGR
ncbi:MAG: hypothetical protein JO346_12810 [Alphaproteobacteria bacterium]|nr:hypothetical protein [Alphaproteobacteria bacterium]